jgi:hypothetical protein
MVAFFFEDPVYTLCRYTVCELVLELLEVGSCWAATVKAMRKVCTMLIGRELKKHEELILKEWFPVLLQMLC